MRNLKIGLHLKLFCKSKILVILYLSMYATTLIPLGIMIAMGESFSYIFYIMCRFIFYESILFMILSYTFLISDKRNGINEVINAIDHKKKIYLKSSVAVLGILLILYQIFLMMILLVTLIKNHEFEYFYYSYIISFLMNLTLPQLICFIITSILALMNNLKLSSFLLILSMILMSPFITVLQWQSQPIIPIDQIVNIIQMLFSAFMQHSEYTIDYLYGYQNEIIKLWLLLIWIILFIILYHIPYIKKHKQWIVITIILLGLCSYNIYKPQSIYRINNQWDSAYADYYYYGIDSDIMNYNDTTVNYTISEYNLDITIKDQLYVEGTLHVHSDDAINNIMLTLYHNYQINKIESDDIQSYDQDGDYITINFYENITDSDIDISYCGYHNNLFSNELAVELPGYFPWYPMVGEKSVYFYNNQISIQNYGLNPYNRNEQAEFYVTVNANYNVISNLEGVENHIYSGTSDSLTILGGYVEQLNNEQLINYYPLALNYHHTLEDDIQELYDYINNTKDNFEDVFGLEITDFDDKKIILASKVLSQTQESGKFALFDDYIIMTDGYFDTRSYITYKLFNRFDLNPMLIEVLSILDYDVLDQNTVVDALLEEINFYYENAKDGSFAEDIVIANECQDLINDFDEYINTYGKTALAQELGKVILGGNYEIDC